MSGVSQMLPFVIGGGILIALAFLIDQILGVPQDQLSQLGSYHELAAQFKTIGGAAFGFMLPVLAGYIGFSIAEKPGFVAGFVAGSIASSGSAFGNIAFGAAKGELPAAVSSGFLGALVGGFLAGGVVLFLRKALAGLPRSLEGIRSILLLPLLGVGLTGFLMFLINIPMSAINTSLNNFLTSLSGSSAVLLGLLVGGMMAVDMGGPVNKAAYVFGTSTLTASALTSGGSTAVSYTHLDVYKRQAWGYRPREAVAFWYSEKDLYHQLAHQYDLPTDESQLDPRQIYRKVGPDVYKRQAPRRVVPSVVIKV